MKINKSLPFEGFSYRFDVFGKVVGMPVDNEKKYKREIASTDFLNHFC